jgi:hypothetical protein
MIASVIIRAGETVSARDFAANRLLGEGMTWLLGLSPPDWPGCLPTTVFPLIVFS